MPKVPDHEWGEYLNPEGEEHAPTKAEIAEDQRLFRDAMEELRAVSEELDGKDPYTGERIHTSHIDPDDMRMHLGYLERDYFDKIHDSELKSKLSECITQVERKLFKQFIPFLAGRIFWYGRQRSPMEQDTPGRDISEAEIDRIFENAYETIQRLNVSGDAQVDVLQEIDALKDRFERYVAEPLIFTFERYEETLEHRVWEVEMTHARPLINQVRLSPSLEAVEQEGALFEELLEVASGLRKIAERMPNLQMKERYLNRADALIRRIEMIRARLEAPENFARLDARVRDYYERARRGEKLSEEHVADLVKEFEAMRSIISGAHLHQLLDDLEKKIWRLRQVITGETSDEERFSFSGSDWAWNILGVDKNASVEEVKSAYRSLARRYHQTLTEQIANKERMQRINEAYELVGKAMGFKKSLDI